MIQFLLRLILRSGVETAVYKKLQSSNFITLLKIELLEECLINFEYSNDLSFTDVDRVLKIE